MPGRPSRYTLVAEQEIMLRLSQGETLSAICRSDHLPSAQRVREWVSADRPTGIAARYAHARSLGLDAMAEEIVHLADTCRPGERQETKEIGRACSACGKDLRWLSGWKHSEDRTVMCEGATAEKQVEQRTIVADMTERTKLQIDARKWLLSKMRPDLYGDHQASQPTAGAVFHLHVTQAGARESTQPDPPSSPRTIQATVERL